MRDSVVFYKSFYEAIECMPESEQLKAYRAIMMYALNGEEVDMEGMVKAIFMLIKPQIDENNIRYENGSKGGRPTTTTTKAKPNDNQNITEPKPNVNVKVKETVKENVNDNENVNVDVNEDEEAERINAFPTVITVTTPKDKISFTQKHIEEFELLYPDVDIAKDLDKIQNVIDNMAKCNLYGKNLEDFIIRWFTRTQSVGGNKSKNNKNNKSKISGFNFEDYMANNAKKLKEGVG